MNGIDICYPFDRFVVEYQFNFIMVSEAPISIGGGNNVLGVDNAIARLNNKPYIPGSSLKGILRTQAEKFVRSVYGEDETLVCNILTDRERTRKMELDQDGQNKYKPCIICEIFGGPTVASRLKVHNAVVNDVIISHGRKLTETIRRVSIDRVSGAQAKGRLFDVEYLLPEVEMKWSLSLENIDLLTDSNRVDERSKIILNVIEFLIHSIITRGIDVGGKRSIGYGLLRVKDTDRPFEVLKYSVKKDEEGRVTLTKTDVTEEYKKRIGV